MNTSNIDALATAAEERAELHQNEAKARSKQAIVPSVPVPTPDNARKESNCSTEDKQAMAPSPKAAAAFESFHAGAAGVNSNIMAVSPHVNSPIENTQQHTMGLKENHHDEKEDGTRRVPTVASTNHRHKPSFADKLHVILADRNFNTLITWLPSGKSFCILDKEEFTKKVLPKYFREAKFESFSRRIKRWGFHKAYTNGQKQVVYSHKLFQKDRLDLCKMMNGRAADNWKAGSHNAEYNLAQFENVEAEELAMTEKLPHASPYATKTPETTQTHVQVSLPSPHVQIKPTSSPPHAHWRPHQLPTMVSYGSAVVGSPYRQMPNVNSTGGANYPPQGYFANDQRYAMLEPRHSLMSQHGMDDRNTVGRQLSSLDQEIADLEEQLAILHRLKDLKERRRSRQITQSEHVV